jgi:branched-chain amino acid transport system permease protein
VVFITGINIILAVSLNLINGYTGQFSLGHAGFMSVGAYTAAYITLRFGNHPDTQGAFVSNLIFFGALIAGGAMAAFTGLIVGIPSLRLKGDYLAIVTLGFGEIIRVMLLNMDWAGRALGLNGIPQYTNFFWTFTFVALSIYTVLGMVNSTYGRGFLAVHDDEIAAEAMGLNTTRYKITAFVAGAFFAGVAGGIFAHAVPSIEPRGFDFVKSIEIVVMVILGGMGNTVGVVLAAILLTWLPEFLRPVQQYRMIIYSLLLIILMLTRPQGLFVWKRGARVGGKGGAN